MFAVNRAPISNDPCRPTPQSEIIYAFLHLWLFVGSHLPPSRFQITSGVGDQGSMLQYMVLCLEEGGFLYNKLKQQKNEREQMWQAPLRPAISLIKKMNLCHNVRASTTTKQIRTICMYRALITSLQLFCMQSRSPMVSLFRKGPTQVGKTWKNFVWGGSILPQGRNCSYNE